MSTYDQPTLFPIPGDDFQRAQKLCPKLTRTDFERLGRVWQAYDKHYGMTGAKLTIPGLLRLLERDQAGLRGEPVSQSTMVDRLRKHYRPLYPSLKPGLRRPWLPDPEAAADPAPLARRPEDQAEIMQLPLQDPNGNQRTVVVVADANGFLRIIRTLSEPLTAAMAMGSTWLILNAMDGCVDETIRWCQVLGQAVRRMPGLG